MSSTVLVNRFAEIACRPCEIITQMLFNRVFYFFSLVFFIHFTN